ncbi:MAG: hypothetical protein LBD24_09350 [Spirochaetaceae bacterium]|nr:hypothetical protein [Spirochaetaceae bacterium]
MLLITALAVFWYALVPLGGAFISRRIWRVFRERFNRLRLRQFLDYAAYQRADGESYRFIGGVEAVEDTILWVRNDRLSVPALLEGAEVYILPAPVRDRDASAFDFLGGAPEKIRWQQVTALTEGAKVFIGGPVTRKDRRRLFSSTKRNPLLIIFYDGGDRSLGLRAITARRRGNEYWNAVTPYAISAGAFSLLIVATHFLARPAFRVTVISACIALLIPLLPFFPPGVLFTLFYRKLWWQGRSFRVYGDLADAPLRYLRPGTAADSGDWECRLPDGERYGAVYCAPEDLARRRIPLFIPGNSQKDWCAFGAFDDGDIGKVPEEPKDPTAPFGAVPGDPAVLASRYRRKAAALELLSAVLLLTGIALNILFIAAIIASGDQPPPQPPAVSALLFLNGATPCPLGESVLLRRGYASRSLRRFGSRALLCVVSGGALFGARGMTLMEPSETALFGAGRVSRYRGVWGNRFPSRRRPASGCFSTVVS